MTEFEKKVNEYRENKRLLEELEAMNDAIKTDIIAMMHGAPEMVQGTAKAIYKIIGNVEPQFFRTTHSAHTTSDKMRTIRFKRFMRYGVAKRNIITHFLFSPIPCIHVRHTRSLQRVLTGRLRIRPPALRTICKSRRTAPSCLCSHALYT